MTEEQKSHKERIQGFVGALIGDKYAKGAEEHTGSLWEYPENALLDEALAEVADLATYLVTLKDKIGDKNSVKLLVKRKLPEHEGILPPHLPGDVGLDLVCVEDTIIPPNTDATHAIIIPAGVHVKIPTGYFIQISGRSSAARRGISVQTATLDNGYVGELFSCVWNQTPEPIAIKKGERVAQAILFKAHVFPMEFVEELPITERGERGFGSSGL